MRRATAGGLATRVGLAAYQYATELISLARWLPWPCSMVTLIDFVNRTGFSRWWT